MYIRVCNCGGPTHTAGVRIICSIYIGTYILHIPTTIIYIYKKIWPKIYCTHANGWLNCAVLANAYTTSISIIISFITNIFSSIYDTSYILYYANIYTVIIYIYVLYIVILVRFLHARTWYTLMRIWSVIYNTYIHIYTRIPRTIYIY